MFQEYLIHVFIFPDQWRKMEGTIKQGSIYIISHFTVKEAYGKLKPVFSKYSISFLDYTTIVEVNQEDYMIPKYKFEFVDLEDLDQYVKETLKDEKEELPEFAVGMYINLIKILYIFILCNFLHPNLLCLFHKC